MRQSLILAFLFLMKLHSLDAQASRNLEIMNEASAMIHMPDPVFSSPSSKPMDSATIADMGFEQIVPYDSVSYTMRDARVLRGGRLASESNKTIILLHGVLSSSVLMNKTSALLQAATGAAVVALDLRGHGASDGKHGDIDYINQYADDLADVVTAIRSKRPDGKIILAGHSMGGGIILRFAIQKNHPEVDGYLLMAPLLGHDAPTIPKNAATSDEEPFMKIHLPRIIGLSMYNSIGIHTYDSLPVLFFNLPDYMPITRYSYRSNVGMAPSQYKDGLKAIRKPFLLLVGSRDEAFIADEFEPAVSRYSKGKVVVIDGATHNGVRHSAESMKVIQMWMKDIR